jgi:tetratricopeptide (TPR) repeat protein
LTSSRRRRALEIRQRQLHATDASIVRVQARLAELAISDGRIEDGAPLVDAALAGLQATGDDADSSLELLVLDVAARLDIHRGDLKAAVAGYTELIERRRALGHDYSIAAELNNRAAAKRRAGDLDGAAHDYREALQLCETTIGPSHPNTLRVMSNLAAVLMMQSRYAETEALLRQVVERRREIVPADDWRLGQQLLVGLGRFLMRRHRWADAEPCLREATDILRTSLGGDHVWVAFADGQLGICLFGLDRAEEAAALVEGSLAALEASDRLSARDSPRIDTMAELLETVGQPELGTGFRRLAEAVRSSASEPP